MPAVPVKSTVEVLIKEAGLFRWWRKSGVWFQDPMEPACTCSWRSDYD